MDDFEVVLGKEFIEEGEGNTYASLRLFGHLFRPRSMCHPYSKEGA
jgi:hypothetical protein